MKTTTAKLTKHIRSTKPGDTIVVPLGHFQPHAVQVEKVWTDLDGQIVGDGKIVAMAGCSNWRVGDNCSVCLGWKS